MSKLGYNSDSESDYSDDDNYLDRDTRNKRSSKKKSIREVRDYVEHVNKNIPPQPQRKYLDFEEWITANGARHRSKNANEIGYSNYLRDHTKEVKQHERDLIVYEARLKNYRREGNYSAHQSRGLKRRVADQRSDTRRIILEDGTPAIVGPGIVLPTPGLRVRDPDAPIQPNRATRRAAERKNADPTPDARLRFPTTYEIDVDIPGTLIITFIDDYRPKRPYADLPSGAKITYETIGEDVERVTYQWAVDRKKRNRIMHALNGNTNADRECFNCGSTDHIRQSCPNLDKSAGAVKGIVLDDCVECTWSQLGKLKPCQKHYHQAPPKPIKDGAERRKAEKFSTKRMVKCEKAENCTDPTHYHPRKSRKPDDQNPALDSIVEGEDDIGDGYPNGESSNSSDSTTGDEEDDTGGSSSSGATETFTPSNTSAKGKRKAKSGTPPIVTATADESTTTPSTAGATSASPVASDTRTPPPPPGMSPARRAAEALLQPAPPTTTGAPPLPARPTAVTSATPPETTTPVTTPKKRKSKSVPPADNSAPSSTPNSDEDKTKEDHPAREKKVHIYYSERARGNKGFIERLKSIVFNNSYEDTHIINPNATPVTMNGKSVVTIKRHGSLFGIEYSMGSDRKLRQVSNDTLFREVGYNTAVEETVNLDLAEFLIDHKSTAGVKVFNRESGEFDPTISARLDRIAGERFSGYKSQEVHKYSSTIAYVHNQLLVLQFARELGETSKKTMVHFRRAARP